MLSRSWYYSFGFAWSLVVLQMWRCWLFIGVDLKGRDGLWDGVVLYRQVLWSQRPAQVQIPCYLLAVRGYKEIWFSSVRYNIWLPKVRGPTAECPCVLRSNSKRVLLPFTRLFEHVRCTFACVGKLCGSRFPGSFWKWWMALQICPVLPGQLAKTLSAAVWQGVGARWSLRPFQPKPSHNSSFYTSSE